MPGTPSLHERERVANEEPKPGPSASGPEDGSTAPDTGPVTGPDTEPAAGPDTGPDTGAGESSPAPRPTAPGTTRWYPV